MGDTISEDNMLIDITRTEIEQKLEKSENEKNILIERVETLEFQMVRILDLVVS